MTLAFKHGVATLDGGSTLDSLFYKDAILPRLKRIGIERMKRYLEWKTTDDENSYLERVCSFVEEKFSGYSIYHVDGRFRTARLSTQEQAAEINKAGRYLVDETKLPCSSVYVVRGTPLPRNVTVAPRPVPKLGPFEIGHKSAT